MPRDRFPTACAVGYHLTPLRGFAVPLRGFVMPVRSFAVPLRGFAVPLRGFAVPLRGFVMPVRGFAVPGCGSAMSGCGCCRTVRQSPLVVWGFAKTLPRVRDTSGGALIRTPSVSEWA